MRLLLDTVQGHEIHTSIGQGRISRMALAIAAKNELPPMLPFGPSNSQLIKALALSGLPQKGDPYPHPDYAEYYLKDHIARAFNAWHYGIEMIYEYRGLTVYSDTSTLQSVPTQLHPKDFKPLYVKYRADGLGGTSTLIKKPLTFNTTLPLRHYTVSKTVDFEASQAVLDAFGTVNELPWHGHPKGYWLMSSLSGETVDDGITYTYSATWTTKQKEDWSQFGFLEDDRGRPIPLPEADVMNLRKKPYEYSVDDTVNGVLKAGMYALSDFFSIFGIM